MKTIDYDSIKENDKIKYLCNCSCNNWSTQPTTWNLIEERKEELLKENKIKH